MFAAQSPGYDDDMLVLDSTPAETARSRETVKRAGDSALLDAIGDAAGYGYCASHSRYFYGMRQHLLTALDGTPRAATLWSPEREEREVGLTLLARGLHGGETVIATRATPAKSSSRRSQARRNHHPTEPQDRARTGTRDLRRSPTSRIHHPEHQRHPRTRTPRGSDCSRSPRASPTTINSAPQPQPHPIHHLTVASVI